MTRLAVLIGRLLPYHRARLEASRRMGEVAVLEIYGSGGDYGWQASTGHADFERLTLFPSKGTRRWNRDLAVQLEAALDRLAPDVVALPGWASRASLIGLSWCSRANRPAILMAESQYIDFRRYWPIERIKKSLVSSFGAALVGGVRTARYVRQLGMPTDRIFRGYDVVDNDYFARGAAAARAAATVERTRLGLPDRYFLASCRFIEKKNLFNLLEAFAEYRRRRGDRSWSLVVLGDGTLRPRIEQRIERLHLRDAVAIPGFKQYGELPAYYGLAGAFVHASTVEQWGLVVNEAMAAGLPVLVSNRCGSAADLVENGQNGFTFDPRDVAGLASMMQQISVDDSVREMMGQKSRRIIARWTPETFAQSLWAAAEAALEAQRTTKGPSFLASVLAGIAH